VSFSTNEMLQRKLFTVSAPDPRYYARTLPPGIVKLHHAKDSCYPPLIRTCTFYRIAQSEFQAFKDFHARWSSLPKGCGAQYVVIGDYPIAQKFMLEGSQYTGPEPACVWDEKPCVPKT
jgi:hypothetical protein